MIKLYLSIQTCIIFSFCINTVAAQTATIEYNLNGRSETELSGNPFKKYVGEWTLKEDNWTYNWGGDTESIKIPGHHTVSRQLNTDNSLLSIVDGPEPNGHIFWSYNPRTKEVHHLSSFGKIRAGKGKGTINDNGDIQLKLTFEGEPENTYRIYKYNWINEDEYHMKSVQYDQYDQPTGLFYEGNFVRIRTDDTVKDEIIKILSILDNNEITKEEQIEVYSDNVIHMAPNEKVIKGKMELLDYLNKQKENGYSKMKHEIMEISKHGNAILMRGAVKGNFYPAESDATFPFLTKNLFVFMREDGELKITKVIYNFSPTTN